MTAIPWPGIAWGTYFNPGSTSANPYQESFLRQGSGDASLAEESARLNQLEGGATNRDEREGDAPYQKAVEEARAWVEGLYRAVTRTSRPWSSPHITASDSGEVVFEWWRGDRKITLYFGGRDVEYIKVWGPNIDNEMESGELKKADSFRELWYWLAGC